MQDDSIDGIYDTLKQTAKISQSAGIGLSIKRKSYRINIFMGQTELQTGISDVACVYDTARYVDQGGKRKGSLRLYRNVAC
jgi:ribonucleoside-diphosphate reductase alpha chain